MKTIIFTIIFFMFLQNCSYKPIIDTSGRSGTFDETKATEITNDLQHCDKIAKDNSNILSNIVYWTFSPTMDTKYKAINRKCLSGRGHSLLN